MGNENLDLLLENQSLKNEFAFRGLDLSQVFHPTPDDLERENRFLRTLLDWVQKYTECGNRAKMEAEGYLFPPIEADFTPDNDWYRFELWLKGKPTRKRLKDQLPPSHSVKQPDQLTDDEILSELQTLQEFLAEIRVSLSVKRDVPPRLVYEYLLEELEEEHELLIEGFWHLDGCTGLCPDCFQRPWCELGSRSCWPEDEEAGEMHLTNAVKRYVCASPVSLQVLRKLQSEENEKYDKLAKNPNEANHAIDSLGNADDYDAYPF